jgi:hypothetical protein
LTWRDFYEVLLGKEENVYNAPFPPKKKKPNKKLQISTHNFVIMEKKERKKKKTHGKMSD